MATAIETERQARQAAGAAFGTVTGVVGSAAVGQVIQVGVNNAVKTSFVKGAISTAARTLGPRAIAFVPVVGTAIAAGLTAYSIYSVLKPVAAQALEARRRKGEGESKDNDDKIEKTLDSAGRDLDRADRKMGYVDRLGLESKLKAMERDGTLGDYQRSLGLKGDGIYGSKTMDAAYAAETSKAARATPSQAQPVTTSTAAPQPRLLNGLWDDVKGLFKDDPNSATNVRRRELVDELKSVREQVKNEISGKNASGQAGAGKNYDKLVERQKDLEKKVEHLDKEERDNNPFRTGFQTFAPIGAALGGYALGVARADVGKLKDGAVATAKEVGNLGKQAGALLKSKPNGLLAGTPSGDKAKAIVNQTYALGGAKPAFASPGYPKSPQTAQQVFSGTGRANFQDYATPLINVGGAAVAGTTAYFDTNDNRRTAERVIAGVEVGIALGSWHALASAPALRPAASAVASIEALRHRIVRETATRAPAGVSAARGAGNLSRARGAAGVEASRASGRVAAAQVQSTVPAINAGSRVGVAKAEGVSKVGVAEARGKQDVVRQVRRGQTDQYKDTWMDTRGRIYHRKDQSVRKPSNRRSRAANDNSGSTRRTG